MNSDAVNLQGILGNSEYFRQLDPLGLTSPTVLSAATR